ncbi:HAD-IA family hydrolase [Lacinutrix sp. WUR7]|uniref:HAD family hydrolase n=1 Tax=Lacinutrix sp. WUR7 TaxID=2653681 RepID=UPI00193D6B47|nr:HAD-IA family hydrolase [Lacinutrix sp. WUR7]QRM90655.1 HAD-IA family hydrolase [Lacinutrix sp. WUR7]
MLKAILFDMDGVIVDTEPLHHKAYHKMFDDYNMNVNTTLYESLTGQSTKNVCKKLCTHFNLNVNANELVERKRHHFKDLFFNDPSLKLIDGVHDIIKDYHKNGLTLVLASSASMLTINNIFTKFDLDQYFIAKLSGAELKASKPHPEIFTKAATASGFKRSECLVIEDSTNGIKAAYDAGIYCVGYDSLNSKNQDYSLANKVVSNFNEITFNKVKDLF